MENKKVLLIDDDKNAREILCIVLKPLGFDIVEAENGREGLEKLENNEFDLVVLDFEMPEMKGDKVMEQIKANEKLSKQKVIFLTSYGESVDEFKDIDKSFAREMGAVGYVNKSQDLNVIVAEIEKAINFQF